MGKKKKKIQKINWRVYRPFRVNGFMIRNENGMTYGLVGKDPRPCRGGNTNICVAEGCYGEACLKLKEKK